MCTVSWIASDRKYRLYFNRDEQRSRPRADAPKVQVHNGLEIIAPHDGPGGGSWIAVNQFGLTSFLLNNYAAKGGSSSPEVFRSRGELPMVMASELGMESAIGVLEKLDLSQFRPFYLGAIAPLGKCRIVAWNGLELEEVTLQVPMLTTSSFRSSDVEAYRRKRYLEICGREGCDWDLDQSLSFHGDTSHRDPAFNPLMSREDANTHCISVIEVDPISVSFRYYEKLSGIALAAPDAVCYVKRKGEA